MQYNRLIANFMVLFVKKTKKILKVGTVLVYRLNMTKTLQSKQNNLKHKKLNTMKNLALVSAAILMMTIFATSANAQVTGTATSTATVITPISIAKNVDLNFGNIAVSPTIGGTVVLATTGTRSTGGAGGVTLPASAGTVSLAQFTVSGLGASTYSILLPTTYTISSGVNNMTVNTFTSTPSSIGTLTAGSQVIKVGATLNVAAGQVAGLYTNATGFNVTVNYN